MMASGAGAKMKAHCLVGRLISLDPQMSAEGLRMLLRRLAVSVKHPQASASPPHRDHIAVKRQDRAQSPGLLGKAF